MYNNDWFEYSHESDESEGLFGPISVITDPTLVGARQADGTFYTFNSNFNDMSETDFEETEQNTFWNSLTNLFGNVFDSVSDAASGAAGRLVNNAANRAITRLNSTGQTATPPPARTLSPTVLIVGAIAVVAAIYFLSRSPAPAPA